MSLCVFITACGDTQSLEIQNSVTKSPQHNPTLNSPLKKEQFTPALKLTGRWQLESIDNLLVIDDKNLVRRDNLTFVLDGEDYGHVSGYDGCNGVSAKFRIMFDKIRFVAGPKQLLACKYPPENVNAKYSPILSGSGKFIVDDESLSLKLDNEFYNFKRLPEDWSRPIWRERGEPLILEPSFAVIDAPEGTKLCEIRSALKSEKFPDFDHVYENHGFTIRYNDGATSDDHLKLVLQAEPLDKMGEPILIEYDGRVTVVTKMTEHYAHLYYSDQAIYCRDFSDRSKRLYRWPRFIQKWQKLEIGRRPIEKAITSISVKFTMKEGCLAINYNGQIATAALRSHLGPGGYDEKGFFIDGTTTQYRVGDELNARVIGPYDVLLPNHGPDRKCSGPYFYVDGIE